MLPILSLYSALTQEQLEAQSKFHLAPVNEQLDYLTEQVHGTNQFCPLQRRALELTFSPLEHSKDLQYL